jgi:hypothetical protein
MPSSSCQANDLREARLVRRRVRLSSLFAETLLERLIDQAVLRGYLRGGAPGDLPADLQRFQHRDPPAAAHQEKGGAQTHDAGADHRDIDLEVALQRRVCGRAVRDRGNPERFGLCGRGRHQEISMH